MSASPRRGHRATEGGFTLIELSISMVIFAIFSTVLFSVVAAGHRTFTTAQQYDGLNEQARQMLTRLSSQLRATQRITSVTHPGVDLAAHPDAGQQNCAMTFTMYTGVADDTVDITYSYTYDASGNGNVQISQNSGAQQAVLSDNVSNFQFQLFGSLFQGGHDLSPLDTNHDGKLQWTELDADPTHVYGNGNGTLDAAELAYLNQVEVDFTVLKSSHRQTYQTTIDLRNQT